MKNIAEFVEKYNNLGNDLNEGITISNEVAHVYLKDILNEFQPLIKVQIESANISSLTDAEFENFVEVAVNSAVSTFNKITSEYLVGDNAKIFSNAYAEEIRDMILRAANRISKHIIIN